MQTEVSVQAVLQEKVRFLGKVDGLPGELSIDYYPPVGDRAGFTGLEVLLLALAGCSGQTVASLLRKMNQQVERLEVKASGRSRSEHPRILTGIHLKFMIGGPSLDGTVVEKAISLAEREYCPVWAMMKPGTKIDSSFELAS
jgi:putative redox protein